jgi:hypothetical protein
VIDDLENQHRDSKPERLLEDLAGKHRQQAVAPWAADASLYRHRHFKLSVVAGPRNQIRRRFLHKIGGAALEGPGQPGTRSRSNVAWRQPR